MVLEDSLNHGPAADVANAELRTLAHVKLLLVGHWGMTRITTEGPIANGMCTHYETLVRIADSRFRQHKKAELVRVDCRPMPIVSSRWSITACEADTTSWWPVIARYLRVSP